MWFAMENPLRIQIVGCVKPEVVEGAFRKENLDFFHSSGWMYFGHKNIIIDGFQNTKQKMLEAETWDRV